LLIIVGGPRERLRLGREVHHTTPARGRENKRSAVGPEGAMEIFAYEYSCCRPPTPGTTAAALRAEGRAMLSAVLHDLAAVPGVSVVTLLAEDHGPTPFPARRVPPPDEEHA